MSAEVNKAIARRPAKGNAYGLAGIEVRCFRVRRREKDRLYP